MPNFKDRIQANDRPITVVEVPEWGVNIGLRPLTPKDRLAFEAAIYKNNSVVNEVRELLLIYACVDPDTGDKVFTLDDMDYLQSRSDVVITRLFEDAQRVCKLGDSAVKKD